MSEERESPRDFVKYDQIDILTVRGQWIQSVTGNLLPHGHLIGRIGPVLVFSEDLKRLADGQWMNDILVNAFICSVLKQSPPPRTAAALMGYNTLQIPDGVAAADITHVLLPVFTGKHFIVVDVYRSGSGRVNMDVYDSLGPPFPDLSTEGSYNEGRWPATEATIRHMYLTHIAGNPTLPHLKDDNPNLRLVQSNLRQSSSWECGRAACLVAERVICGHPTGPLMGNFKEQWTNAGQHILSTILHAAQTDTYRMKDVLSMPPLVPGDTFARTLRFEAPNSSRLLQLPAELLGKIITSVDAVSSRDIKNLHLTCKALHSMSLMISSHWSHLVLPLNTSSKKFTEFKMLALKNLHCTCQRSPVLHAVIRCHEEFPSPEDINQIQALASVMGSELHLHFRSETVPIFVGPQFLKRWSTVSTIHMCDYTRVVETVNPFFPDSCATVFIGGLSAFPTRHDMPSIKGMHAVVRRNAMYPSIVRFTALRVLIINTLTPSTVLPLSLEVLGFYDVCVRPRGDPPRLGLNQTRISVLILDCAWEQLTPDTLVEPDTCIDSIHTIGINLTGAADEFAIGDPLGCGVCCMPTAMQGIFPNLRNLLCTAYYEDAPALQTPMVPPNLSTLCCFMDVRNVYKPIISPKYVLRVSLPEDEQLQTLDRYRFVVRGRSSACNAHLFSSADYCVENNAPIAAGNFGASLVWNISRDNILSTPNWPGNASLLGLLNTALMQ